MQCSKAQTRSILVKLTRRLAALLAAGLLGELACAQPTITQQPTNQVVANGGTATFSVAISGTGPFTYQWQLNGTNLPTTALSRRWLAMDQWLVPAMAGRRPTRSWLVRRRWRWTAQATCSSGFLEQRGPESGCNGIITTVAGVMAVIPATAARPPKPVGCSSRRGGGQCGQPVHRGFRELPRPQGGLQWHHHDSGGQWHRRLFRRWRPGDQCRDDYPDGVAVDSRAICSLRIPAKAASARWTPMASSRRWRAMAHRLFRRWWRGDQCAVGCSVGVAVDSSGDLFIADTSNYRIRKVNGDGIITTVAGNGTNGYAGDGCAATNAQLSGPLRCDGGQWRQSIHWGHGQLADSQGGHQRHHHDCGGQWNQRLCRRWRRGDQRELALPTSVAVDVNGNLFIADQYNNVVREVATVQGPTLTLNGVSLANAGNYQVVVTSLAGSVTSSGVVTRIVLNPPVITTFNPQSGTVGTVVKITGLNFDPVAGNNTVYFGAVRAVVSAASATNLVVSVPAGATYAPITETVNGLDRLRQRAVPADIPRVAAC